MPVSPQDVLGEAIKMHFIRTQSRGMHLFNVPVTKWTHPFTLPLNTAGLVGAPVGGSCELTPLIPWTATFIRSDGHRWQSRTPGHLGGASLNLNEPVVLKQTTGSVC